ncbi:unnamed protein product [Calypogeia fissa]
MQVDDNFAFHISEEITNDTPDPLSVAEAQSRTDWPQWELAINLELDSLIKQKVFGPVIPAPAGAHLMGYRFIFVRKRNAKGEVIRHKARLVAKGYTQIPGRDFDQTYSPVMDSITYRYLIAYALLHKLVMHILDVITAYFYGILDTTIYMKAPPELIKRLTFQIEGEKTSNTHSGLQPGVTQISPVGNLDALTNQLGPSVPIQRDVLLTSDQRKRMPPSLLMPASQTKKVKRELAVQVLRSVYGLKQSGRTWYKRFKAEMLTLNFITADIAPCLFLKQEGDDFVIIAIYVDDINIFGTAIITAQTIEILKKTFEMRDIGKPNYCLGLQFNYPQTGILINQSTYTEKILKQFNMDSAHPVSTPMDLRSSDATRDTFKKRTETKEILGPKKPYLSDIGALMYLATQSRPDIAFAVNLLACHSAMPTIRHWNGVKRVFRYLRGTTELGLFFPKHSEKLLIGYADAGYLSNPDDAKSQTGYVFLQGGTAISWKSCKQSLTATTSNHAEIIALYEATRECIWRRHLIDHINTHAGRPHFDKPTTLYEDNRPCVEQIVQGFIKGDRIKHIAPKFFYTHEQHGEQVKVKWISSKDNRADLFTKPLPPSLHREHTYGIGMRSFSSMLQGHDT